MEGKGEKIKTNRKEKWKHRKKEASGRINAKTEGKNTTTIYSLSYVLCTRGFVVWRCIVLYSYIQVGINILRNMLPPTSMIWSTLQSVSEDIFLLPYTASKWTSQDTWQLIHLIHISLRHLWISSSRHDASYLHVVLYKIRKVALKKYAGIFP
jgi:hypothetical protein